MARSVSERASRPSQRIRGVSQPTNIRARSQWTVVEPPVCRPRVLRTDADHEETEAAGLSRLTIAGPLKPERGTNTSIDLTRVAGPLSATVTGFYSRVVDPVEVERTDAYVLRNLVQPTTNVGVEAIAIWKADELLWSPTMRTSAQRNDRRGGRRSAADPTTDRWPRWRLGIRSRVEARR